MKKNTIITLLAVVGAALVLFAVYHFFFASGCSDCPTFEFYYLDT